MSIFDEFDELDKLFKKLSKMSDNLSGSSGYSISVTYGPDGKPIVDVKTYGNIDKARLKREISSNYPGAIIRGLDEEPLIKEVSDEEEEKEKRSDDKNKIIWEE
jgi:hypothetical protein